MLNLLLDSEEVEYLYRLLLNDFNSSNRVHFRKDVQRMNDLYARLNTRHCYVSKHEIYEWNENYFDNQIQIKYAQINMELLACLDRMMPMMKFTEIEEDL